MTSEWTQWYYLVFLIPLGVAALLLLLSAVGGRHGHGGHGHFHFHSPHGNVGLSVSAGHGPGMMGGHGAGVHGAGVHGGVQTGASTGHAAPGAHAASGGQGQAAAGSHGQSGGTQSHPGAGAHGSAGGKVEGAHSGAAASHGAASAGAGQVRQAPWVAITVNFRSLFGIGQAPVHLALGSLLMGWGVAGMLTTECLESSTRPPSAVFPLALVVGGLGAVGCAKLISTFFMRYGPQDESYAITPEMLVGLTGTVVYPVSETGGRVHIFDQYRTLHIESARICPGHPTAPKGEQVVVIQADREKGYLVVDSLES